MVTNNNRLPIRSFRIPALDTELQRTANALRKSVSSQLNLQFAGVNEALETYREQILGVYAAADTMRLISQPMLDLIEQITTNSQLDFARALAPVVDQLANQLFFLGDFGRLRLGLRVDQAARAWHLAAQPPRPLGRKMLPQVIADVGHTAVSINATAAVIEGEILETDEEPWLIARTEAVDRIVDWLSSIHPRLATKFKGMWHAVHHRGPDCVSQAANSAIELIDHTLRTLGPDAKVLAWQKVEGKYAKEISERANRPHRSLRIRYIAARRGLRASSVDLLIKATTGVMGDLQGMKHAGEDQMFLALSNALQGVEFCLLTLMGDES